MGKVVGSGSLGLGPLLPGGWSRQKEHAFLAREVSALVAEEGEMGRLDRLGERACAGLKAVPKGGVLRIA